MLRPLIDPRRPTGPDIGPARVSWAQVTERARLVAAPTTTRQTLEQGRRLNLMSLSRQRPVEPVVFSAVEFTYAAHPLLRFLCEISTAQSAACAPWEPPAG